MAKGACVEKEGVCVAKGGMHGKGRHAWQREAFVAKGGHAWQKGDMHGEGGHV